MYQKGRDGVDQSDQYRQRSAGFAVKHIYKEWYKIAYFVILDLVVLNAFFDKVEGRLKVDQTDFF